MYQYNLAVSSAPHIRDNITTTRIMLDVVLALMPAFVASILIFGARSVLVVLSCAASCVFFEWLFEQITKRPCTIRDLSALVTGILLGFNLPVGIPLWQAVFGSAVAIIAVKQLFGGIGFNFANPAITARIVMFLSFPTSMTTWVIPSGADALSGATPLPLLAAGSNLLPSLGDLFLGLHGGSLGETCALALLAGGGYLLIRRVITWHIPVAFLATVFLFSLLLGQNGLYHLLSGGVLLGAVFMATDYTTAPPTPAGKLLSGVGAGIITVVIRCFGNYPEGVSFAILLMNILVPYIIKLTEPKAFGGVTE